MTVSTWERLSVTTGGTVAGFACDGAANVFAATMAGVFRSSDGGTSWAAASLHGALPFCEAIASDGRHTLYAGGRAGLHRSDDDGRTWVAVLSGGRVSSLAASGDLLLVGTEQDGIVRSENRGQHFVGANAGLADLMVLALALSPEFERDGTGFAATPSGLYRTRNRGKSWRPLDVDAGVQCVSISPRFDQDSIVLAGTEADGLLRSDDAGTHWSLVPDLDAHGVTAIVFLQHTIAAATEIGIAMSADAGASWRMTAADVGSVLALAPAPGGSGDVLLAGLHRHGVARAVEPFDSWTASNSGLHARSLLGLALSPAFEADQTLFAAGPDDGVLVSNDAGRTWTARLVGPEDPPVLAVQPSADFAHDRSLFAATAAGVLGSRDAGATWQPLGVHTEARVIISGSSLVTALTDGQLLRSEDNGDSWQPMGAAFDSAIVALASAPDDALFVATRGGDEVTLWRSTDDGTHWTRWLVEHGGDLLSLAVSPGHVYVGIGSRVLTPIRNTREVCSGEQRPLWRQVDLGASITAIATPRDAQTSGVVFVGTNRGVYVSRDGGERFTAWDTGDGPTAAVAVAVSPNYAADRLVYALQLGGAVWCRRDLLRS